MQSQLFLKILLIYLLFFIFDQTTHNMRENVFFFISPVFLFISLSVLWFSRNLQAACNLYVCSKRPVNIFKYHQTTHILYEKNRDFLFSSLSLYPIFGFSSSHQNQIRDRLQCAFCNILLLIFCTILSKFYVYRKCYYVWNPNRAT